VRPSIIEGIHESLTKAFVCSDVFKRNGWSALTKEQKENMFMVCSLLKEAMMLKMFVEEAAALASIALFVGMLAVWAQILPQL
jgi:hypothetical protein